MQTLPINIRVTVEQGAELDRLTAKFGLKKAEVIRATIEAGLKVLSNVERTPKQCFYDEIERVQNQHPFISAAPGSGGQSNGKTA